MLSGFRLADENATSPIVVEDYVEECSDSYNFALYFPKRKAQRSFSASDKYDYSQDQNPQETIDKMHLEIVELRKALDQGRKEYFELRRSFERIETLLQMEQATNRELEIEKAMRNEDILCLQNELERLRDSKKTPLILADGANILQEDEIVKEFGDPVVRHSSWSNLAIPGSDQDKRPRRRKMSAPCGPSSPMFARSPSVSKAKTLCFQISFNGMTLMEKTDFGED